jgi:Dual OB-containing domain
MRILVNHLTRMQPGYFCAAGVDLETETHVRPVLRRGRLTTDLLSTNGGPFDIGAVLDLGPTANTGRAPELEDHRFDPAGTRRLYDDNAGDYWDALERVARESLEDIFGPALELWDESGTVDVGEGHASLGCLKPEQQPWIYVDHRGTVRLVLDYLMPSVDLSVTDLRLYEGDGRTPRRDLVQSVQKRLESGVETILSVGLTRPWQKRGDDEERHWLQLNNIHLKDDPLWSLRSGE